MIDFDLLYERVKDIENYAPISVGGITKDRVTNIAELLLDGQKDRMARCFYDGTMPYESLSDYERFSLFASNACNMAGSGALELFSEELALLLDYKGAFDKECTEQLWEKTCKALEMAEFSAEKLSKMCGIIQQKTANIFPIKPTRSYSKCYLDYIDEMLYNVTKNTISVVFCDISRLSYVRTDIFHCEESYKRYMSSREYSKDDENMLICGMLYSICEYLKKERRAIWLYVGDNVTSAERLIGYLSERRVLPNVYAIVSDPSEGQGIARLSGYQGVSISFAYELGDTEHRIAHKILSIASVYPIALIRYAGVYTSVAMPQAAHNIVKRGVCRALVQICQNEDVAVDLFKKIFGAC